MRNGVGEATGGTWPTYWWRRRRWEIKEWEGKRKAEGAGKG